MPDTIAQLKTKRKWLTIGLTCIIGWTNCFLAMNVFQEYATGLFLWLPLVMGFVNRLIYGNKYSLSLKESLTLITATLGIFYLGLLFFAMEGIICLIMAAPLVFVCFLIGHFIAQLFIKEKKGQQNTTSILIAILSVPVLLSFDTVNHKMHLRTVTTKIEINAPPELVWENLVAFPRLKAPTEFIFKTGIAYPVDATIEGKGVGAVRHCNFTTGSFVEPITVWDEPKLLRFSVREQPEPMKELSIYNIHPNHLHGFWNSKQGEFKLTVLPNGNTLLTGTTWYENRIKPNFYWSTWSDYIVHKIHKRVLDHIKIQAELAATHHN